MNKRNQLNEAFFKARINGCASQAKRLRKLQKKSGKRTAEKRIKFKGHEIYSGYAYKHPETQETCCFSTSKFYLERMQLRAKARQTLLARAFVLGITYKKVEPKVKEGTVHAVGLILQAIEQITEWGFWRTHDSVKDLHWETRNAKLSDKDFRADQIIKWLEKEESAT